MWTKLQGGSYKNRINSNYGNSISGAYSTANSNNGYLLQLQSRHKDLTISVNSSLPVMRATRGNVKSLSIHPSVLREMQNDSEKGQHYDDKIKDIERAIKTTNGLYVGLGYERTASFWHIDESGEIWGGGIVVRKDELNKRLREEAGKNAEEFVEKNRGNNREAYSVSISDEAKQLFFQESAFRLTSQQDPPLRFEAPEKGAIQSSPKDELTVIENARDVLAIDIKPRFNDLQQFAKDRFGYEDVDWSDTEKSSEIVRAFTLEAMSLAGHETKNSKYSVENLSSLLNFDSTPFMYKDEKAAFFKALKDEKNNY